MVVPILQATGKLHNSGIGELNRICNVVTFESVVEQRLMPREIPFQCDACVQLHTPAQLWLCHATQITVLFHLNRVFKAQNNSNKRS